ncbi:hypothetical protein LP415_02600 [Polaromonas sp. P1(28)-8]|nr:hypothetical protein LP415_02600 [Polaromonas sp. P1(28)-8]
MPIKYRAIHERVPWKRVGNHENLLGAIDGEKGAKNVLLGIGEYVQKLWADRGRPSCIFVWEDGKESGYVFRINPASAREVQEARVPVKLLQQYDKAKGCSQSEIEGHFLTLSPPSSVAVLVDDPESASLLEAMEGFIHEATVLSRGRNAALRNAALTKSNGTCEACSVMFSTMLGGMGLRVLHVHHREQLALRDVPGVTRLEDLAIVCANCHALIHVDPKHALSVEQLRKLLAAASRDA